MATLVPPVIPSADPALATAKTGAQSRDLAIELNNPPIINPSKPRFSADCTSPCMF